MIKVTVNRETCRGYGNCVLNAEKIFELDGDGLVVLLTPTLPDEQLAEIQSATYDCPTASIVFEQVDSAD